MFINQEFFIDTLVGRFFLNASVTDKTIDIQKVSKIYQGKNAQVKLVLSSDTGVVELDIMASLRNFEEKMTEYISREAKKLLRIPITGSILGY